MRGISKTVLFLGLASLFADIASEAIYPLLPIFLSSVIGVSVIWLGAIEGIAESVSSITKVFAGTFSDRIRKQKIFVFLGYLLSTFRFLIGLSTQAYHVLSIRLVDRVGKGIRTAPRDAWLSQQAVQGTHGKIFGFHRGMDNLGAALAPLLAAIFLFFFPDQLRLLFCLTIIPGLIAMYFVYRAMKISPVENPSDFDTKEAIEWKSLFRFSPTFYKFLALFFFFALAASADSFLILKLHDLGLRIEFIPLVWFALNAMKSIASFWGGGFSDRVGARSALVFGWIIYSLCYGIFSVSLSLSTFFFTILIYGLSHGLIEAPEKVLVAKLAPEKMRGTAYGLYHLVVGIAYLPANLLVGWLWYRYGSTIALGFSAGLSCVATVGLILFGK